MAYIPVSSVPSAYVFGADGLLLDLHGFSLMVDGGSEQFGLARHVRQLEGILVTAPTKSGMTNAVELNDDCRIVPVVGCLPTVTGTHDATTTKGMAAAVTKRAHEQHFPIKPAKFSPKYEPVVLISSLRSGRLELYVLDGGKKESLEALQKAMSSSDETAIEKAAAVHGLIVVLVWHPAKLNDPIKRILYTGNASTDRIFGALEAAHSIGLLFVQAVSARQAADGVTLPARVSVPRASAAPSRPSLPARTAPAAPAAPRTAPAATARAAPTRAAPAPAKPAPAKPSPAKPTVAATTTTRTATTARVSSAGTAPKPRVSSVNSNAAAPTTIGVTVKKATMHTRVPPSKPVVSAPAKPAPAAGARRVPSAGTASTHSTPARTAAKPTAAVAQKKTAGKTAAAPATADGHPTFGKLPPPIVDITSPRTEHQVEQAELAAAVIVTPLIATSAALADQHTSLGDALRVLNAPEIIVAPPTPIPQFDSDDMHSSDFDHLEEDENRPTTPEMVEAPRNAVQNEEEHIVCAPTAKLVDAEHIPTAEAEPHPTPASEVHHDTHTHDTAIDEKHKTIPDFDSTIVESGHAVTDDFPTIAHDHHTTDVDTVAGTPTEHEPIKEVSPVPAPIPSHVGIVDDLPEQPIAPTDDHTHHAAEDDKGAAEKEHVPDVVGVEPEIPTPVPHVYDPEPTPVPNVADPFVGPHVPQAVGDSGLLDDVEEPPRLMKISMDTDDLEKMLAGVDLNQTPTQPDEPSAAPAVESSQCTPLPVQESAAEVARKISQQMVEDAVTPFTSALAASLVQGAAHAVDSATAFVQSAVYTVDSAASGFESDIDTSSNDTNKPSNGFEDKHDEVSDKMLTMQTRSSVVESNGNKEVKYEETDPVLDSVLDSVADASDKLDQLVDFGAGADHHHEHHHENTKETTPTPHDGGSNTLVQLDGNDGDWTDVKPFNGTEPRFFTAPSAKKKMTREVYVELTTVPHSGNKCTLASLEEATAYFNAIRANYYVLGTEDLGSFVLEGWLAAKKLWNNEASSTIIPTAVHPNVQAFTATHGDELAVLGLFINASVASTTLTVRTEEGPEDFKAIKLAL